MQTASSGNSTTYTKQLRTAGASSTMRVSGQFSTAAQLWCPHCRLEESEMSTGIMLQQCTGKGAHKYAVVTGARTTRGTARGGGAGPSTPHKQACTVAKERQKHPRAQQSVHVHRATTCLLHNPSHHLLIPVADPASPTLATNPAVTHPPCAALVASGRTWLWPPVCTARRRSSSSCPG